jgi:hypothetical protein
MPATAARSRIRYFCQAHIQLGEGYKNEINSTGSPALEGLAPNGASDFLRRRIDRGPRKQLQGRRVVVFFVIAVGAAAAFSNKACVRNSTRMSAAVFCRSFSKTGVADQGNRRNET